MTNSNTAVLKSIPLCFFVLFCTFALILAHFKISDNLSHLLAHLMILLRTWRTLNFVFFQLIQRCCNSETSLKCDMVLFCFCLEPSSTFSTRSSPSSRPTSSPTRPSTASAASSDTSGDLRNAGNSKKLLKLM